MKKLLLVLTTLVLLFSCATALAYTCEGLSDAEFAALDTTTVLKSPDSPTGYIVTFRYTNDEVSRVRIYGEWSFTDINHVSKVSCLNATPEQWKPGYFVCSNGGGWPTADMERNENGIWCYTIPLPNGSWNYRFVVGGTAEAALTDETDAFRTWDPGNAPLHSTIMTVEECSNSDQYLSTVYVPFDPEKQVDDFTIEAARTDGKTGTVYYAYVEEQGQYMGVYLPYGYDANKEGGYKVLYLGSNNTVTWFGIGRAQHILDNAIAEGLMEPTLVVSTGYMPYEDLVKYDIPFVLENFNATTDFNDWALVGYSASGMLPTSALFDPDHFGRIIPMSTFIVPADADFSADYVKEKKVLNIHGLFEVYWGPTFDETPLLFLGLHENGIPYTTCWPMSTHNWVTWRTGLAYACTDWLWK